MQRTDEDQAKDDLFFEELGNGCNVTRAARLAGYSVSQVYRRRGREAGFRARWGVALGIGFARLEMEMLERALVGSEKPVRVDGKSQVVREYNDRTALALLKMHRETVAEMERGVEEGEYEEACERVLAKLKRLRTRAEDAVDEAADEAAGGGAGKAIADGLPGGAAFAGRES